MHNSKTAEEIRLDENRKKIKYWARWGPFLAARQWGTVREDYSNEGNAWDYFPHEHARMRAYRWGEDGILGISDNHQRLCFAITLWNGNDPILKERYFGVTGLGSKNAGNHGEDVKEYYYYLDNVPSHSYMKGLYRYPQQAFPYQTLLKQNKKRGFNDKEFKLLDTGIFDKNEYFDIYVEYAKQSPLDILIKLTIENKGPKEHELHILPTLWFRNDWSWDKDNLTQEKPVLKLEKTTGNYHIVSAHHKTLGDYYFYAELAERVLFTDNMTNKEKLWNIKNDVPYVKDAFHETIISNNEDAVNPEQKGTKAAPYYRFSIESGEIKVVKLRLVNQNVKQPFSSFSSIMHQKIHETKQFYNKILPFENLNGEKQRILRQALAGMFWTKQYYHYIVDDWLSGDPIFPIQRNKTRNANWTHFYAEDVLSMPDKWEYPWFAAWDLAFHVIPIAIVDPQFAKAQLVKLTREWYMHPNGQLPAYEWNFNDVNPPVHPWAAYQVYKIEYDVWGRQDKKFLERVFQKLLLNFTWWVNRKDTEGRNVFAGGFLGLDNIGVFDRSKELHDGHLEQSDGTSWMAFYSLTMMKIALELAVDFPVYEDIAQKFFEHFFYIVEAMNHLGGKYQPLWDEKDGFYYDILHLSDGSQKHIKLRSLVGLIPLFAVEILEPELLEKLPNFKRRINWFLKNKPHLAKFADTQCLRSAGKGKRLLLTIIDRTKLHRILNRMLDTKEFLSPYGIRSLSKVYQDHPYTFSLDQEYKVKYIPGESDSWLFGGNSNWRGPIWFPINYLIIKSLQKYHKYYGDSFNIACPTSKGKQLNLWQVSSDLSHRLMSIFLNDKKGNKPAFCLKYSTKKEWNNQLLFHEYFHGDTGQGLGAAHQTGWTGLIINLIKQCGNHCELKAEEK